MSVTSLLLLVLSLLVLSNGGAETTVDCTSPANLETQLLLAYRKKNDDHELSGAWNEWPARSHKPYHW